MEALCPKLLHTAVDGYIRLHVLSLGSLCLNCSLKSLFAFWRICPYYHKNFKISYLVVGQAKGEKKVRERELKQNYTQVLTEELSINNISRDPFLVGH